MKSPILSVEHLSVEYRQAGGGVVALDDVSFTLFQGETLGLVGESGSGKSTLALALMNLLPAQESRITSGRLWIDGVDVSWENRKMWREIRGKKCAMVFQDPFSSLNPVMTVASQLNEALEKNKNNDQRNVGALLSEVHLTDFDRILKAYPHQLSGGQRQRVLIAIALAQNPQVLIADEPTTALDVTVQADIIKLLKRVQATFKLSMIFITHNLGLVKRVADRVAVLKKGVVIEEGQVEGVLHRPQQAYTRELLASVPRLPVKFSQNEFFTRPQQ